MEELKGDGETMRSLCDMLVSGGVVTGCRKGCRGRKNGKWNVEDRR